MDQWKPKLELHQQHHHLYIPNNQSREMTEDEAKDANEARKVQKADHEKLRRDKLNEQFIELGNVLDPDRPKNNKASIIIDTIQVLKDLTTEVNRLKAECRALSEESSELTQEKNELREEKSSLKSDIENLNAEYQQRVRSRLPWGAINPSVVLPPSFPVTLPVHTGPISMHPFPFFTNRYPTSASAFMPYPNQAIPVYASVAPTSYSSSKSTDCFTGSNNNNNEKPDDSSDLVTVLELKTPGSRSDKKGKQPKGGCSSSRQTSSSNSVVDNSERV
ncbi:transcription factor bHLH121-like [Bidens hawaiensis]|uniref:transcription factor bHLH121-like n=1 Tax=Bidens hawaiensis TaxID=980011 RepID=UPI004049FF9D